MQEALKYGADWLRAEVRLAQGRVDEVIRLPGENAAGT